MIKSEVFCSEESIFQKCILLPRVHKAPHTHEDSTILGKSINSYRKLVRTGYRT